VQVDPFHTVMLGDSTHDLQAARAAGMAAVGVLTGVARAAELAPHADAVLADIGELPTWLIEKSGRR
jgi:phosphoglycolate phosphatase